MPKAKRAHVINFHKTKKKDRTFKSGLVEKVKKYLKDYQNVIVFTYQCMTTNSLKYLRNQLSDCQFCLGKNKLMKLAFGLDEETEQYTNAHMISDKLQGQVGVLFTNRDTQEVIEYLRSYAAPEFANPGTTAIADVELLQGADVFDGYSTSNEDYLKKLGLDMEISDSKIHLVKPFLAAEKGKPLTAEQSKILKFLGIKLSQFKLFPTASWNREGDFVEY